MATFLKNKKDDDTDYTIVDYSLITTLGILSAALVVCVVQLIV